MIITLKTIKFRKNKIKLTGQFKLTTKTLQVIQLDKT